MTEDPDIIRLITKNSTHNLLFTQKFNMDYQTFNCVNPYRTKFVVRRRLKVEISKWKMFDFKGTVEKYIHCNLYYDLIVSKL